MEAVPARPHSGGEADIDEYPDELLEMDPSLRKKPSQSSSSTSTSHSHQRHSRRREYHPSIAEEDESAYSSSGSSPSMDGFEMLHNAGGGLSLPPPGPRAKSRTRARSSDPRSTFRAHSRRPTLVPELRQLRVKVHHGDDTRYMMVTPDVAFEAFLERVKEKFALKAAFRLKTKDEGDLITMGDADDWQMAVGAAKKEMATESRKMEDGGCGGAVGSETGMGKMEVWVSDVP